MKKKILIVLLIILFVSILLIFLYDKYILNLYSNAYFSIEYNNDWKKVNSDNQSIYLSNANDSHLQIVASSLNTDDKEAVYFDLHKKFLDENKSYVLLSSGETKVGKNYYESYEYLFKSKKYQSLLIILISDEKLIQINYTSSASNFLFDLEYFYDVANTLEL